jgi:hypothetical protein
MNIQIIFLYFYFCLVITECFCPTQLGVVAGADGHGTETKTNTTAMRQIACGRDILMAQLSVSSAEGQQLRAVCVVAKIFLWSGIGRFARVT